MGENQLNITLKAKFEWTKLKKKRIETALKFYFLMAKNRIALLVFGITDFIVHSGEIANIFDDLFGGEFFPNGALKARRTVPAVNVKGTTDEYYIEVAAAGMKKDDFKVEVNNNVLIISCQNEDKKEESEKGFTHKKFPYSAFRRSFAIPRNEVDEY